MAEIRFDKIIRSGVPDLIRADGLVPITTTIEDQLTRRTMLCAKLLEEIGEYMIQEAMDGTGRDELPDILEALEALALAHGMVTSELEAVARARRKNRGDFDDATFLVAISIPTPEGSNGDHHDDAAG
jgi:predicted house-cleaning noncanonical NTP pyrophosphatase (MazG superfamily)